MAVGSNEHILGFQVPVDDLGLELVQVLQATKEAPGESREERGVKDRRGERMICGWNSCRYFRPPKRPLGSQERREG